MQGIENYEIKITLMEGIVSRLGNKSGLHEELNLLDSIRITMFDVFFLFSLPPTTTNCLS